jgi:hypothetical protein
MFQYEKKNYTVLICIDHYSQPDEIRGIHEQKKVNIVAFIIDQFLE